MRTVWIQNQKVKEERKGGGEGRKERRGRGGGRKKGERWEDGETEKEKQSWEENQENSIRRGGGMKYKF